MGKILAFIFMRGESVPRETYPRRRCWASLGFFACIFWRQLLLPLPFVWSFSSTTTTPVYETMYLLTFDVAS